MKRIVVLFLVLSFFYLFGCSTSKLPESSTLLVVILDKNNNSKDILPTSILTEDEFKKVYSSLGNFCVIVSDANPSILSVDGKKVGYLDEEELDDLKNNFDKTSYFENTILPQKLEGVISAIQKSAPDDDETDILKALQLASNLLIDMENKCISNNVDKKIIICSSGLSTSGDVVNFCKSEWNSFLKSNQSIENSESMDVLLNKIQKLDSIYEIPDLSDTTVEWYGIGQVSDNSIQPKLSKLSQHNLQFIWSSILQAAHAIPYKNNDYFNAQIFDENNIQYDTKISPVIFGRIVVLNAEIGNFKENTAEFNDVEAAKKYLTPIAKSLIQGGEKYVLAGTTANDGTIGQIDPYKLSIERANAVKDLLISMGVDDSQLKTVGLGSDAPWHINEINENGDMIPEIAAQNRAVVFLPYDSEESEQILKLFE